MDSGLNSTVLASDNEMVILPVNEPTFGTRRKSQIQVHFWQTAHLCSSRKPWVHHCTASTMQTSSARCPEKHACLCH